jgi:chromosome segregation ATPase
VVAVPEALDVRAVPVEAPEATDGDGEEATVGLHVVPDDGARLAGAEEAVEEAIRQVSESEHELVEVEQAVESLNARRLQLQGEADELRRRLAAIETDVDQVDDDLEDAEEAREDAAEALAEARRAQEAAEQALARLR